MQSNSATNILPILLILLFFFNSAKSQIFNYSIAKNLINHNEVDSLQEYLSLYQKNNEISNSIQFNYLKGVLSRRQSNKSEAVKYLNLCIQLSKNPKIDSLVAFSYDELAIIERTSVSTIKNNALDFINKSIEIKNKIKNSEYLAKSYIIKGNIYYTLSYFFEEIDSAEYFYNKASSISNNKNINRLAKKNVATIHLKNKDYSEAEVLYKEVLQLEKNENNVSGIYKTVNNLASLYTESQRYDDSKIILDTLLTNSKKSNFLNEFYSLFTNKAKLSDSLKNYSDASRWKDSLIEHQHLLFNKENEDAIEKYKNATLEVQLEKERTQKIKNRFQTIIISGIASLLALLSFAIYRFQKLRKKAIESQLEKTKIQAVLDATKAKMLGEQEERKAIASVLHDQVASLLTAADMHLKVAKKKSVDQDDSTLETTGNILKDVNEQVRNLSHQLVSPTLMKFGLEPAIDSLVQKMQQEELHISFEHNLEGKRIESAKEIFLYRCCAELLQNILKHSNANEAKVQLVEQDQHVSLIVSDNGQGYESLQDQPLGLGLVQMKTNAEGLRGDFQFMTSEKGVDVTVSLPVFYV